MKWNAGLGQVRVFIVQTVGGSLKVSVYQESRNLSPNLYDLGIIYFASRYYVVGFRSSPHEIYRLLFTRNCPTVSILAGAEPPESRRGWVTLIWVATGSNHLTARVIVVGRHITRTYSSTSAGWIVCAQWCRIGCSGSRLVPLGKG